MGAGLGMGVAPGLEGSVLAGVEIAVEDHLTVGLTCGGGKQGRVLPGGQSRAVHVSLLPHRGYPYPLRLLHPGILDVGGADRDRLRLPAKDSSNTDPWHGRFPLPLLRTDTDF